MLQVQTNLRKDYYLQEKSIHEIGVGQRYLKMNKKIQVKFRYPNLHSSMDEIKILQFFKRNNDLQAKL